MLDGFYALLAKWGFTLPLHPFLVCLPAGLVTGGFIFYLSSLFFKKENLAHTSYHCLFLALISMFPTAVTGVMDWMHFSKGLWSDSIQEKLLLTSTLALLLGFTVWGIGRGEVRHRRFLGGYLLMLLMVVLLKFQGWQLVQAIK
jgi:uncharacterized membrane protein